MSIQLLDRTKTPDTGKQIKLQLEEPKLIVLDNGLQLYLIKDTSIEFARLDFVFSAGTSFQKKNLVAESTLQLLTEGTISMKSKDIADKFDYYGSIIDTNLTKDTAAISVYSLTKHIPEILPLVFDIIQNPTFADFELSNYLNRNMNQFKTNYEKIKFKASLRFNELVFGNDTAYGRTKQLSDFQNVVRDDIVDFHNINYNLQHSYIVASGDINDRTIELINKYLGGVAIQSLDREMAENLQFTVTNYENYVEEKDSMQSAIRIGQQIISKTHPDYDSLVVLNTVLGGYFGSRLMSNIREDKGLTYGINSYMINYLHGGYWCIATEVVAQNTNLAIDEIIREISKLKNEPIPHKELEIVKNYIYGSYLRRFNGPISLTDRFRASKDLNIDYLHYNKSLLTMMNQSPEQLLETANKYLDYNKMIKLVVGKLEDGTY